MSGFGCGEESVLTQADLKNNASGDKVQRALWALVKEMNKQMRILAQRDLAEMERGQWHK